MNLKKSQDRINEWMSIFEAQVKIAIATDKLDTNRVSEDVLIPLFSEIYGYRGLRNLNVSEGPNFPAIDLGDEETRTAYQITSRSDSRKIKETLEKFVKHELYEKYDRLIIYILTKKQKRYQGSGFNDIIQGKFTFDKDNDILDLEDLLREISGFSLEKSRKVENILEQHFGDRQENTALSDSLRRLFQGDGTNASLGMEESERDIPQLSDTAKTLLKEGSQDKDGRIWYLLFHRETVIETNGKNMIPNQNPRVVAQWEAALKELEDAGFLESKGDRGETFNVTARGYEIADMIDIST